MSNTIISLNRDRIAYEKFVDYLKSTKGVSEPAVTRTILRMDQKLDGQTSISFSTKKTGVIGKLDNRLNEGHLFCITDIALKIKQNSDDPTFLNANYPLFTYPDKSVFTDESESNSLETIYQGYLSMKVDSTVYIDRMFSGFFKDVPDGSKDIPASNFMDGFAPNEGYHIIDGTNENSFTLELGNGSYEKISGSQDGIYNEISLQLLGYYYNGTNMNQGSCI